VPAPGLDQRHDYNRPPASRFQAACNVEHALLTARIDPIEQSTQSEVGDVVELPDRAADLFQQHAREKRKLLLTKKWMPPSDQRDRREAEGGVGDEGCSRRSDPRTSTVARPAGVKPSIFLPECKVFFPSLVSGIKQARHKGRKGIDATQIRPLVEVTAMACKREIVYVVGAAMFSRNHMLDMM
jgi:hypothetical protein